MHINVHISNQRFTAADILIHSLKSHEATDSRPFFTIQSGVMAVHQKAEEDATPNRSGRKHWLQKLSWKVIGSTNLQTQGHHQVYLRGQLEQAAGQPGRQVGSCCCQPGLSAVGLNIEPVNHQGKPPTQLFTVVLSWSTQQQSHTKGSLQVMQQSGHHTQHHQVTQERDQHPSQHQHPHQEQQTKLGISLSNRLLDWMQLKPGDKNICSYKLQTNSYLLPHDPTELQDGEYREGVEVSIQACHGVLPAYQARGFLQAGQGPHHHKLPVLSSSWTEEWENLKIITK